MLAKSIGAQNPEAGYALLESGIVSRKNEVNILVKNATNVLVGGFSYWAFGFGLSFGKTYSNLFIAIGSFFVTANIDEMGVIYSKFVFELAYATTATTLISGAMAERCKFTSYCMVTVLVIFVYSIPAGWMWRDNGFLAILGAVDVGGSGTVHLVGGCCGLVAAALLGPRTGRYDKGTQLLPLGNPTNALLGLFMLCGTILFGHPIHWCAKIKDEVEKLAYQLNEEAERTERPIRRLSRIIGKLEEGRIVTSVAAEFGSAHSIVSRLWRQFQTTGTGIRGFSSGRPRGTTPADDRYIVLQARRNRRQTAEEIARHTTQATG
ncbi:putative ammonium transporter 3 [Trichonephila clavipes]|nr:putative ammonium transporter 3 [Trichonephila clavipes]